MNEVQSRGDVLKSAAALVAGLLTVIVPSILTDIAMHASGVFPPLGQHMDQPLWALATAYRMVYAVAGSYVAARLAPKRPMLHALALGAVGLAVSIAGVVATWNAGPAFGPKWYSIGLAVTAMPCAWAGGMRFTKQSRERPSQ